MNYQDFLDTEFFQFFNLSPVGQETTADGQQMVFLKTGGFQEYIDMVAQLADSGNLTRVTLMVDRQWLGSGMHLNLFARDLVKSFIATLVPDPGTAGLDSIVDAIWQGEAVDNKEVNGRESNQTATNYSALSALDVFAGLSPEFGIEFPDCYLEMKNEMDSSRKRLQLSVHLL